MKRRRIFWTFIFLIIIVYILFACQRMTPEKEMTQNINKYRDFVGFPTVDSVQIIDTIFHKDVVAELQYDSIELKVLEKQLLLMDSLIRENRKKWDSSNDAERENMRRVFEIRHYIETRVGSNEFRTSSYQEINIGYYDDDIVAYKILVYSKNLEPSSFIIRKDFLFIRPSFLFEQLEKSKNERFEQIQTNKRRPMVIHPKRNDLGGYRI